MVLRQGVPQGGALLHVAVRQARDAVLAGSGALALVTRGSVAVGAARQAAVAPLAAGAEAARQGYRTRSLIRRAYN